jgi:hypothetical protein
MHIEKTFFEDLMLVPPCLKENGNPPAVSLVPHRRTWRVLFKIQRLPRLSTLRWKKEKEKHQGKKAPAERRFRPRIGRYGHQEPKYGNGQWR